jgi:hypothetical protein
VKQNTKLILLPSKSELFQYDKKNPREMAMTQESNETKTQLIFSQTDIDDSNLSCNLFLTLARFVFFENISNSTLNSNLDKWKHAHQQVAFSSRWNNFPEQFHLQQKTHWEWERDLETGIQSNSMRNVYTHIFNSHFTFTVTLSNSLNSFSLML